LPGELSPPPVAWEKAFSELAKETELKLDLPAAFLLLKDFYGNI
jgi:hypothetical protein